MVNLGKKCSNFIMKISSKKHIYILCVCKLFKQDKSIPCRGILKIVFQPKVYCLKMNTSFFIFLASIEYCVVCIVYSQFLSPIPNQLFGTQAKQVFGPQAKNSFWSLTQTNFGSLSPNLFLVPNPNQFLLPRPKPVFGP